MVIPERKRSQITMVLSKTLYGALEHNFTDVWSGFVRGYGYDNRTNYDAYYSPGLPLVDTRKLYSQSWDAGLRYNGELIKSQLITSYSHSKDYNYDPHYGRYDSSATLDEMKQYTVQWANNIIIGHGNIGAGVDWQKQSTAPGTAYVEDGYDQRNTGIYLTGLQQVGDFTLKAQDAATIILSLVVMVPGKPAPVGSSSKVIALLLPTEHLIRHQILGNCMAPTVIRI